MGITGIEYAAEEARSLLLIVDREFAFGEELRECSSYSGHVRRSDRWFPPCDLCRSRGYEQYTGAAGGLRRPRAPWKREGYYQMEGVRLETNSDLGGSQNVAFLDVGDYMDYYIDVAETGPYAVDYRTASDGFIGGLTLQLFDSAGGGDGPTDGKLPLHRRLAKLGVDGRLDRRPCRKAGTGYAC